MKRIIVLFTMLILSIVSAGCNKKENSMKIICNNESSEKQMSEHIDNDLKKNNMFKNNNLFENIDEEQLLDDKSIDNSDYIVPSLPADDSLKIYYDSLIILVNQKYKEIEITIDYFNSLGIEVEQIKWLNKDLYYRFISENKLPENFVNVYCITLSEKNITKAIMIKNTISNLYFVDKVTNVVGFKFPKDRFIFSDIKVSEIISSNK